MIYLYLKTHNITGLKYLGKTINDPYSYSGSGTDWIPHLKEHGDDVDTVVLFQTEDKVEFRKVATRYSEELNIVESEEFANRMPEQGQGGVNAASWKKGNIPWCKGKKLDYDAWNKGKPHLKGRAQQIESLKQYYKDNPDASRGENNGMYGKTHSLTMRKNRSKQQTVYAQSLTEEERKKKWSTASGKKWYVFEDGSVIYTTEQNDERFKTMKYHNGRIFKKERVS